MKTCSKCNRLLDETNFNWKIKNIKLQYHCKECSRKYIRNHYLRNTLYYREKAQRRNSWVKSQIINFLGDHFSSHPCIDCGEKDVLVLEFDHRDKSQKFNEVSKLIKARGTLQSVINEIDKCDVRCANCHRRKTAVETKSWRLKYSDLRL